MHDLDAILELNSTKKHDSKVRKTLKNGTKTKQTQKQSRHTENESE